MIALHTLLFKFQCIILRHLCHPSNSSQSIWFASNATSYIPIMQNQIRTRFISNSIKHCSVYPDWLQCLAQPGSRRRCIELQQWLIINFYEILFMLIPTGNKFAWHTRAINHLKKHEVQFSFSFILFQCTVPHQRSGSHIPLEKKAVWHAWLIFSWLIS